MPRSVLRRPLPRGRAVGLLLSTALLAALPASADAEGWVDGPSFSFPLLNAGGDIAGAPNGSATAVSCGADDFSAGAVLRVQHASPSGAVVTPLSLGACDSASAPVAATAVSGQTAVAWWSVAEDRLGNDVSELHVALFAADGGELWDQTLASSDGTDDPALNVSVDSAGDATVVWSDPADGHVRAGRVSADGAVTTRVDLGAASPGGPQLATAPDGTTWVAWITADSAQATFRLARIDPSGQLVAAADQSIGEGTISDVRLGASAAGGLVTWSVVDSNGAHIAGLRLPSSGDLTGSAVQTADEPFGLTGQYASVIAPDGTVTIAWTQIDPAQLTSSVMLSRFTGQSGGAQPQTISGPASGTGAKQPALAVAANGGLLATWLEVGGSPIAVVAGRRLTPDGMMGPISRGPRAAQSRDGPITLLPSRDNGSGGLLGVAMPATVGGVWLSAYYLDATVPSVGATIPAHVTAGTPLTLSAAASDRSGASFWWDFGDESGARAATVHHAFATPGTYTVTLTVTDGAENSTVASGKVTVTPAPEPLGGTVATPHTRRSAALKLAKATRRGARVTVGGAIAKTATGRVTITYAQRVGGRTVSKRAAARIAQGRWQATFKLGHRLARATRGKAVVIASYAGDAQTSKATAKRAVTTPHKRG